MKLIIYKLIEKGAHGSRINIIFDYFITSLILLNVIALMLETFPKTHQTLSSFLSIFELISIIIFTIEYILRVYISNLSHPAYNHTKSALKFIFSPFGIIDILAILPFYLPLLITIDLRFLRLLRLMRFFRIFKINRYNNALTQIWAVINNKKSELLITGFVSLLVILTSSFLMYEIEGKAQPEKFSNILDSFWWSVATLTTVGYGDVYPITAAGKFISGLIAILGIGLIALPTGIISAGFMEKINKKNAVKKCPCCGCKIQL